MCVFGVSDFSQDPLYFENGKDQRIPLGLFVRKLFIGFSKKNMKLYRLNFERLDDVFIGAEEREL